MRRTVDLKKKKNIYKCKASTLICERAKITFGVIRSSVRLEIRFINYLKISISQLKGEEGLRKLGIALV